MGTQLTNLFNEARSLGGLPATIRLATLSRISSIDAKSLPDSPDDITKLKKNLDIVKNEFGGKEDVKSSSIASDDASSRKLRKFIEIFSQVLTAHSLHQKDLERTAQQITSALSDAIKVDRASIWLYNEDETAIVCLDLFEKQKGEHSKGAELKKIDFPNYFKTIATSRTLAAEDAHTHPGTSEFSEVYLKPLGIDAMLDVPIFVKGKMVGVICHENVGAKRKWNSDEENFAYIMGNIVGLSLENETMMSLS